MEGRLGGDAGQLRLDDGGEGRFAAAAGGRGARREGGLLGGDEGAGCFEGCRRWFCVDVCSGKGGKEVRTVQERWKKVTE